MNRAELIASVRDEYELLEKLGGTRGVREQDKERLYNLLSVKESAPVAEPVVHSFRVCAKDFVFFVFNFANVRVDDRNHTTRRMRLRMGDKMEKTGHKLYFRSSDLKYAFDCMLKVLIHDSSNDKDATGTKVSSSVLQLLQSHKDKILELYVTHATSRTITPFLSRED